jgi:ABC-type sugar transport system permease subunit
MSALDLPRPSSSRSLGLKRPRFPQLPADRFVRLSTIWQFVAAGLGIVGVIVTFTESDRLRFLVVVALRILCALSIPARLIAGWQLGKRTHRGRALAFGLDYLTGIGAGVAVMHQLRMFSGFDGLGGQFRQDFKPIIAIGIGFLIARFGLAQRTKEGAGGLRQHSATIERVGLVIAGVALVWFLLAAGLLNSLANAAINIVRPMTLATLAVAVAAIVSARGLHANRTAQFIGTSRIQAEALDGWIFLSPNLIGFAVFFVGPLLFSLIISFSDWNLGAKSFVGLSNYGKLFALQFTSDGVFRENYVRLLDINWFGLDLSIGAMDIRFWKAIKNIIIFVFFALPLSVIPALLIAQLLTQKLRGMKAFRAIFFIPSVAGVVSISLIWKLLLNSSIGYINYFLTRLSNWFDFLPGVNASEKVEIVWLSESWTIIPLAVVFAWMTFGFNTVLFTAGMQGVPQELHEAAALDGATAWQRFRSVTIPLLRPTTFYVTITTTVLCLQMFDIVWVLTNPPGGPADATLTPVLYTYDQGFQLDNQGYAAAVAWVLAIFLIILAIFQFRRQRRYTI